MFGQSGSCARPMRRISRHRTTFPLHRTFHPALLLLLRLSPKKLSLVRHVQLLQMRVDRWRAVHPVSLQEPIMDQAAGFVQVHPHGDQASVLCLLQYAVEEDETLKVKVHTRGLFLLERPPPISRYPLQEQPLTKTCRVTDSETPDSETHKWDFKLSACDLPQELLDRFHPNRQGTGRL
jgi:hypothetical protein